jgi:hypothetical protein
MLTLEIQLSRGQGWDPINWFNPPHVCVLPKPGPGYLTSYVVVLFWCSVSEGER